MKKKQSSSKKKPAPPQKEQDQPKGSWKERVGKLFRRQRGEHLRKRIVKEEKQRELSLKSLAAEKAKKRKKQMIRLRNRQILRKYLDRAGYDELNEGKLITNIFRVTIAVCLFFTLIVLIVASIGKAGLGRSALFVFGLWTGVFAGLFVLAWIVLYIFLDLKIFNRTLQVEDVLPDFLQLASANISAGMPIDRALWFAVRPRFGILAKEIEDVAKSTTSGADLNDALTTFTSKYDSVILKRSFNLLIEGMEAGGELASLLNKIALNIQETRILKKEMAANVMTYVIFISFATVVAAPVLYGLSGQLLVIIQQIMQLMASQGDGGGSTSGMFSIDFSGDSITVGDYRIFAVTTLFMTGLFSGFIISTIRKGNIKEGFRFIPAIVIATLVLYLIASWILGLLMGGIIDI